ncbi:serine/threonine-protein kinase [Candidatus Margulisiibacteriota bacterium]
MFGSVSANISNLKLNLKYEPDELPVIKKHTKNIYEHFKQPDTKSINTQNKLEDNDKYFLIRTLFKITQELPNKKLTNLVSDIAKSLPHFSKRYSIQMFLLQVKKFNPTKKILTLNDSEKGWDIEINENKQVIRTIGYNKANDKFTIQEGEFYENSDELKTGIRIVDGKPIQIRNGEEVKEKKQSIIQDQSLKPLMSIKKRPRPEKTFIKTSLTTENGTTKRGLFDTESNEFLCGRISFSKGPIKEIIANLIDLKTGKVVEGQKNYRNGTSKSGLFHNKTGQLLKGLITYPKGSTLQRIEGEIFDPNTGNLVKGKKVRKAMTIDGTFSPRTKKLMHGEIVFVKGSIARTVIKRIDHKTGKVLGTFYARNGKKFEGTFNIKNYKMITGKLTQQKQLLAEYKNGKKMKSKTLIQKGKATYKNGILQSVTIGNKPLKVKGLPIGGGAYGNVYKVISPSGKVYALKEFKPTKKLKAFQLFENEVNSLYKLKGNNHIMKFIRGVKDGNKFFLITEFIDGKNLKKILFKDNGLRKMKLDPNNPNHLMIALQICRGILFMHSRGFVHRDIKPENIMLTKKGIVKIVDFGTCKSLEGKQKERHNFVGTPNYVAPEVIRDSEQNSKDFPKTDIFSMGALLYKLFAKPNHFTEEGGKAIPIMDPGFFEKPFKVPLRGFGALHLVSELKSKNEPKYKEPKNSYEFLLNTIKEMMYHNPKSKNSVKHRLTAQQVVTILTKMHKKAMATWKINNEIRSPK